MAGIRVSARAVDMLGRQQIAGIPTALHELFKNAHDAYADRVEVDYYRPQSALLLRDDGIGMTMEEFESRWLTLGTESKLAGVTGIKPPYRDPDKPERAVLGEKGIGRLAIAAIGRQLLVLTRAKREKKLHNIVVCFVNWGLFEVPGLDLSDIEIPVREWTGVGLPDKSFVDSLKHEATRNLKALKARVPPDVFDSLILDLNSFEFDPRFYHSRSRGPSLENDRGTHFFVCPVDPILESDIDGGDSDIAPPLKKNLVGFCNSMVPGESPPPMQISFRDHRHDGSVHDLVESKTEFFTPSDYNSADHHFEGEFDEFGQFVGNIKIYGGSPVKFVLNWPGAKGKPTKCGPFRFKMAYVQGLQSESKLPPEIYGPLIAKLDQIGGLYLYRDGVRILPYGNSDYDWVNIELRKSKSHKDYFFSYRRVFGAVLITKEKNSNLVEKAGREGFMENAAYRQMRDIISHFLIEVARERFRKDSEQADDFWRVKNDLQQQRELLKKRENRARKRKQDFAKDLGNFFQNIEADKPATVAREILGQLDEGVAKISELAGQDPEEAGKRLIRLENELKGRLADLRKSYNLKRPRGLGLTKNQSENWNAYVLESERLEKKQFGPLEERIRTSITNAMTALAGSIDKRRRIDMALAAIQKETESQMQRVKRETNAQKATLDDCVVAEIREHITNFQSSLKETLAGFERENVSDLSEKELEHLQLTLERQVAAIGEKESGALEGLRDQLAMLSDAILNDESIADVTAALEDRAEGFRAQVDQYAGMAQIGTAVGIIQHEFSSTVSLMRNHIRQLRAWADVNPQLNEIYRQIRTNFEHLDEYMNVFKPFDRRLQRSKVSIPGQEIRYYLMRVFEDRLERHGVELKGTRKFDNASVKAYPSTIYPCFVNLIDNAIYWLTKDAEGKPRITKEKKQIYLDANEYGMSVGDNGPGVERRIASRIFEFGYSRKKNGQGMGLYIAREILRRDGMDLILESSDNSTKALFRIVSKEGETE